jgi:hypothetical protein
MMRENREFFARMAAQQGLSSAEMREMLERRLAAIQPTVIDARSVNVDARSVVDARTDARTVTIHNIADNRSVAQVVNVSGPPPPPPPGAGAIRGPTGPLPIQRWSPYPAPALADQLAITAGPPPPPPPPPAIRARSATIERPAAVEKERARTRSPRRAQTNAERAAARAAREEAKRAQAAEKERERLAKAAEKERLRQLKKIAREALVQDARRKLKRPKEFDISDGDPQRPRAPDPWLEPEEAAAAAEAAVKRRRVRPKAKAKAQPKARARAQTPDVIRRVPVRELDMDLAPDK